MTTTKTKRPARDPKVTGVRLVIDGRPQGSTLSKISNLAYFHTQRIGGATVDRISTKDLVAVLAKLGVGDPYKAGWSVELPNGVKVAAVRSGSAAAAAPAPAKGARATSGATVSSIAKQRAKKQTATKRSAAKKPAGKKVAGKKRGAASTPVKAGRLAPRRSK